MKKTKRKMLCRALETAKKKKGVRNKELHFILALNDCCKRINTITKISITAYDVDSGKVIWISVFKHGVPP